MARNNCVKAAARALDDLDSRRNSAPSKFIDLFKHNKEFPTTKDFECDKNRSEHYL